MSETVGRVHQETIAPTARRQLTERLPEALAFAAKPSRDSLPPGAPASQALNG